VHGEIGEDEVKKQVNCAKSMEKENIDILTLHSKAKKCD
jgi:hypothetical protein